eukprot:2270724-Lingulodinium_polyedra.AAC.1
MPAADPGPHPRGANPAAAGEASTTCLARCGRGPQQDAALAPRNQSHRGPSPCPAFAAPAAAQSGTDCCTAARAVCERSRSPRR